MRLEEESQATVLRKWTSKVTAQTLRFYWQKSYLLFRVQILVFVLHFETENVKFLLLKILRSNLLTTRLSTILNYAYSKTVHFSEKLSTDLHTEVIHQKIKGVAPGGSRFLLNKIDST